MKYKIFHASFFNHFIQPSPPSINKLKSLRGDTTLGLTPREVSTSPIKMVKSLCSLTPYDNFKISPNLYAFPCPINMATIIRQHTTFLRTARSSRQT